MSTELVELAEEFAQFRSLMTSDHPIAIAKRERLKQLIHQAMSMETGTGRARLAWWLRFKCQGLIKSQARPGFELLGEEMDQSIDKYGDAHSCLINEETLYPDDGGSLKRQRHVTRRHKSLRNIINSAFLQIEKRGRPRQLQRDLRRLQLYEWGCDLYGLNHTEGLRFVGGMQVWLYGGPDVRSKRPLINIGTHSEGERWLELPACLEAYPTEDPRERIKIEYTASLREIERSIERARDKQYKVMELPCDDPPPGSEKNYLSVVVEEAVYKRIGIDIDQLIKYKKSS